MKQLLLLLFAIALFGIGGQAFAFCQPGDVQVCFVNGVQGTRACNGGVYGPCSATPPPLPSLTGLVLPRYKILNVIYAPPGTLGGGSTSSVTYGSGSSAGTTTSTSSSFKEGYSVTASQEAGFLGTGGEIGASFGWSRNSSNTQALDIEKTGNYQINHRGPAVDGIDHDRDQIWLWLNPRLKFTLPPDGASAVWTLDSTQPMDLQYVYVGHLKNPSQMPPGVTQRLQSHGITEADYPEILQANPYAYTTPPIDSNRYKQLQMTFPYEPPFGPQDPVPTLSFNATYSSTDTSTNTSTHETVTGLTVVGTANFANIFKTKLEFEGTWTWSDTETRGSSSGTNESAAVTIGGPAYGYTGPTDMRVYYDTLYKTFLFVPIELGVSPAFRGTLSSYSEQDLAGRHVQLVADGLTYSTFTNANGEYRFYGDIVNPSLVQTGKTKTHLSPGQTTADIVLP